MLASYAETLQIARGSPTVATAASLFTWTQGVCSKPKELLNQLKCLNIKQHFKNPNF